MLLPLGIALCIRLLPAPVLAECREQARESLEQPRGYAAAAVIAAIWLGAMGSVAYLVLR